MQKMVRATLTLALLLPAAVRAEVPDNGLEYGVKLCGREFIRTVVMSCGGSRWKRYSPEPGQERSNPYRELLDWLNSDHFFLSPEHLNFLPEDEHQGQDPAGPSAPLGGSPIDNLLGLQEGQLRDPDENGEIGAAPSRGKRNAGPAGSCCRRGCTKSELVRFC
ncbi:insulin-like 3 [Ambystoma mexicanum]|uniref:insulin-like 3 n=1 Tax=Ambystoma mexicanum TaxID=8296 RepID=UPI0037E9ABA7